ncbi:MAG: methionine adenosyltransferase [Candidatus Scalindua sp.]|nr:methionine adenosyltransferase [Candidatus Scalindua sp.]
MIVIETLKEKSVSEHSVEIVERKGTGHPDYMCDSMMDAISVALSKEYIKEFGTILHHNIDKSLLAAGMVEKRFGGGIVTKPMELTIGDRATFSASGRTIPVSDIAIDTAKKWLRENMRFVDPEKHLKYNVALASGSDELTDIFLRPGKFRGANDTSAAVGYYPLSHAEKIVFELERHLNSTIFKKKHPETGEDVKIMGLRKGENLDLTIAMPLLASYVQSVNDYFEKKNIVHKEIVEFLRKHKEMKTIEVHLNTLDEKGRGPGGIYLSLLGTSAEDADSGQVGRGNRVNGLISVNRPMGTEASAGKNPVSHVGKVYNVLSHKIARKIYESTEGIKEVYVLLLSRIGTPIDKPQMATAQILFEEEREIQEVQEHVEEIFDNELRNINTFCLELGEGKHPIC